MSFFKEKFKEILEISKQDDKIPLFLCLLKRLSEMRGLEVTTLISKVIKDETIFTNEEIKLAGKKCIELGKFFHKFTLLTSEEIEEQRKKAQLYWSFHPPLGKRLLTKEELESYERRRRNLKNNLIYLKKIK